MENMLKLYLKGQKQDLKLRDKILKHSQGRVSWIASQFQVTPGMREDLIQEGYLGLLEYLESPSFTKKDIPDYEDKLFQIVYSRMMSYRFQTNQGEGLKTFLTSEKGIWDSEGLEERIQRETAKEEDELTEIPEVAVEEKYPFVVGSEEYIDAFLGTFGCTTREKDIVKDKVLRDLTGAVMSKKYGLSTTRVNKIYQEVVERIKKALSETPGIFFGFYKKYGIRL